LNEAGHLHTTNYTIIETLALLQSRLGFEAAYLYSGDILRLVDILWVSEPIITRHQCAFSEFHNLHCCLQVAESAEEGPQAIKDQLFDIIISALIL